MIGMPSKIQLDENLWFLYICLQKSDMKAIDFNAVAIATSLKAPAARMRYTRLKRQIESGTLIGTHGTPFSEPSSKKRNRIDYESKKEDDEDEEGSRPKKERGGRGGVKKEQGVVWSEDEGYSGDNWCENEGEESEDEMPLAKLRKKKMIAQAPSHQTSDLTPHQNMDISRFLPPMEMMSQQVYGDLGYGGLILSQGVGGGDGSGQWVDYEEAARAWQRARNWHLEHVDGR